MSRFVTCVSKDLVEYCRSDMLHDNMNFGRLMVDNQQIEEDRRKKRVHDGKKPKTTNWNCSSSCMISF